MRRRRLFLTLLCGLTFLFLSAVMLGSGREPSYQGRTLGTWLILYARPIKVPEGSPTSQEAAEAIRRIGTNAFPCMLKWIQYRVPWWKNATSPLASKLHVSPMRWNRSLFRADAAKQSFQVFGKTASPLIPELARIMGDPKGGEAGRRALRALAHIGDESLPVLLMALQNPAAPNRYLVAGEIRDMQNSQADINLSVPVLLNCLSDGDQGVVRQVGATLDELARDKPTSFVSALTNGMDSLSVSAKVFAAEILGNMKEAAVPALPTLRLALSDPNPRVRGAAAAAVHKISGEP